MRLWRGFHCVPGPLRKQTTEAFSSSLSRFFINCVLTRNFHAGAFFARAQGVRRVGANPGRGTETLRLVYCSFANANARPVVLQILTSPIPHPSPLRRQTRHGYGRSGNGCFESVFFVVAQPTATCERSALSRAANRNSSGRERRQAPSAQAWRLSSSSGKFFAVSDRSDDLERGTFGGGGLAGAGRPGLSCSRRVPVSRCAALGNVQGNIDRGSEKNEKAFVRAGGNGNRKAASMGLKLVRGLVRPTKF